MAAMNKKTLSEQDIRTKYITPALVDVGWDIVDQIREEVTFTDGRIYVRGKIHTRGKKKRADYILYYKPNIPIAVVEAKDNTHTVGAGMQQALGYAETLDIPFVFSSNGDGFVFHDKTLTSGNLESELSLDSFPSPEALWAKYKAYRGITAEAEPVVAQDYFRDGSGRSPRYYQQIAINRTVEAIAQGDKRVLLVMATGTGKTYAAFQIIHRLWKSGAKKRILFLADRTALIDQTVRNDFRPFKEAMTVVKHKNIDTAYNIYLALYQGLSDNKSEDAYKQFSRGFFDLIVVDECHRGSAREDSKWREILDYFSMGRHTLASRQRPKRQKRYQAPNISATRFTPTHSSRVSTMAFSLLIRSSKSRSILMPKDGVHLKASKTKMGISLRIASITRRISIETSLLKNVVSSWLKRLPSFSRAVTAMRKPSYFA